MNTSPMPGSVFHMVSADDCEKMKKMEDMYRNSLEVQEAVIATAKANQKLVQDMANNAKASQESMMKVVSTMQDQNANAQKDNAQTRVAMVDMMKTTVEMMKTMQQQTVDAEKKRVSIARVDWLVDAHKVVWLKMMASRLKLGDIGRTKNDMRKKLLKFAKALEDNGIFQDAPAV